MEEKKLLELLRYDSERGIREATTQYGKAVHTICCSMLRGYPREEIEEVEADTFLKLWKNSDKIQIDESHSLKSYLYTIARNTALDVCRKKKPQILSMDAELENLMEAASGISVEKHMENKEISNALHEVIAALGEPDNQVFLYKYFLMLRNKEIARHLQIVEKKVENILYRGKEKLRKQLAERGITSYEGY